MKYGDIIERSVAKLKPVYGTNEAIWLVRTMFEHLKGWSQADLLLKKGDEASDYIADKIERITARVASGEPIQYIFGETYWHGMKLKVTPDVLIPRPETSELVDMICDDWAGRTELRILDLCTGSGCIAIALCASIPFSQVSGIDISGEALAVARENARARKVRVSFDSGDVLSPQTIICGKQDIIVSNPPYITEREKDSMDANVLEHEPHIALFVPDNDPLRFYKPISRFALSHLEEDGMLYLEINPDYAIELRSMLESDGWHDVEILRDMYGRERFAKGRLQRL